MPDDQQITTALGFRFANADDCELLTTLNAQLIRDEQHRNAMALPQLAERMSGWLASTEYEAIVFETGGETCGYALYRLEPDHVDLRQFLVLPQFRRRGIGTCAIQWLWQNAWPGENRLRIEVLVGNAAARAFWTTVGFRDYCVTMEAERAIRTSE